MMQEFKLVVKGLSGVGKSALTVQLTRQNESGCDRSYDPTLESAYRKQVVVDAIPCSLDIIDVAGQEAFTAMQDNYNRPGDGFLLVFAVENRKSFEEIPRYREQIRRAKDRDDVPMVLVAMRCDVSAKEEVNISEAANLAKTFGIPLIEISLFQRDAAKNAFFELVREIRRISAVRDAEDGDGDGSGGGPRDRTISFCGVPLDCFLPSKEVQGV